MMSKKILSVSIMQALLFIGLQCRVFCVPLIEDDCLWIGYCDLLKDSARFEGRFIATDAIMVIAIRATVDAGDTFLYLPDCNSGMESFVFVDSSLINESDSNVIKPFRDLLDNPPEDESFARFRVILTGKFDGPVSGAKYGYPQWALRKLTLKKIERLERVDDSVPKPYKEVGK